LDVEQVAVVGLECVTDVAEGGAIGEDFVTGAGANLDFELARNSVLCSLS
jgi:hypothetical protein